MNENQIKFYLIMIYMGIATAVVLLVIDFKLKADTVKMLGGSGGARPDHSHSNWNSVRFANSDLHPLPNERFAPRMEEGTDSQVSQVSAEAADSSGELGTGTGDNSLPKDD